MRLQSSDPTARLIWTTGIFFAANRQNYLEQIHDPSQRADGGVAGRAVYASVLLPMPNGNPDAYDPRFPNDSYFLQTYSKDKQIALFGEGTYAFTDQLKLTVGAALSRRPSSRSTR